MQETKEAPITGREERVLPRQRLCVTEKVNKIVLFSCERRWNSHCEICAEPHINTAALAHIILSACIVVPWGIGGGLQLMVHNYCIAFHFICCTSDFAAQT